MASLLGLIDVSMELGKEKDARKYADAVMKINPDFPFKYFHQVYPYKDPTHLEPTGLVTDKLVSHLGIREKMPTGFFKMSRSCHNISFSLRRRASSSSCGLNMPLPGKASSGASSNFFFKRPSTLSRILRSLDACAMLSLPSVSEPPLTA
jgi:hypothetical protein